MSDFTMKKLSGQDETTEFLHKAVASYPPAEKALLILFDEDGRIVGLGSNDYPLGMKDSFADQLNEMLAAIHAGKGLQS